ncbi:Asp23/Gls24 family envelope stress response protein [Streptomyces sp. NRRL S-118]|uniref:Asp23/Gls24 family envelope stress response protein n=1 Tax=Streptomyces sp. NRRL S-118 TaxID=1463881 RepID=UPI0004C9E2E5|nr:Asp23/Gls24 family envelope stress response protein [Streptomyces sp. NRRL S-118]
MTASRGPGAPGGRQDGGAGGEGGGRVGAADRGATTLADRVVAKIAAQAAREALDGLPEGGVPQGGKPPHASVVVHRDSARVRISLELGYPSDLGAQCGAVRHHVGRRVETLAGLRVPEVAIRVERLHSPHGGGRDRRRVR